jgi:peptidoglycan/LPS O-acetylase OafA/YrhL
MPASISAPFPREGKAVELDGDNGPFFPELLQVDRWDRFTVDWWLRDTVRNPLPVVVMHRTFGTDVGYNGAAFLINHPTFTVAIEATYYLISPFLLRRSVKWAIGIVAIGFLYHMAAYVADLDRDLWRYFFVGSAAFFYFLGVCAYHAYSYLSRLPSDRPYRVWLARLEPALYPLALIAALVAWRYFPAPNLLMALALALVIPLLFQRTKRSRLDRTIGELSYGIYLVHFPLYLLLLEAFDGPTAGILTGILSVAGAIVLYVLVETPIDRWRQRRARTAMAPMVGAAADRPDGRGERQPAATG